MSSRVSPVPIKQYRYAQLLLDGQDNPAPRRTIQLGEENTAAPYRVLEGSGLRQAVMPGGSVEGQQDLVWGTGV